MKKVLLFTILLVSTSAWAQVSPPSAYTPQLITYQGVPFGVCSVYQIAENVTNGNYYTCNISTHLWQSVGSSVGSLSLSTTSTNSNGCNSAILSISNTNIANTAGIMKMSDGSFVISNDCQLIPSAGYFSFSFISGATGDVDLRAGSNGASMYFNTKASVNSSLPQGSVDFELPNGGVGTAKYQLHSGSPNNYTHYWDSGTGCTSWFVQSSTSSGSTMCPPASGSSTVATGNQCGTVAANGACSNTAPTNYHCVSGSATLSTGASTITGIAPAFANTSFTVVTSDTTTVTNGSKGVPASSSSITFTGTGSDTLSFIACGG